MSKIALAGNASGTGTITLESPNTNTDFTINLPAASGTLVTTGGTVTFGAGTAAAPSITNSTDTNTGIYFPAADTIGFTEGGAESLRLNSSGNAVFAGSVTVAGTVQVGGIATNVYPLVSGTAQNAAGTAVDFTGIPSWVKRVTVMFSDVSTTGSSSVIIQLGGSGGIEVTGYDSAADDSVTILTATNGLIAFFVGSTSFYYGSYTISLCSGSSWVGCGNAMRKLTASPANISASGGKTLTLSSPLDRIRVTTVNGTDTFDAGTINILYE
jgi:hypothetical protein